MHFYVAILLNRGFRAVLRTTSIDIKQCFQKKKTFNLHPDPAARSSQKRALSSLRV